MLIPQKPLSLMNCQTSGGRSRWTLVVAQSLTIAQSSCVSWSRKRCSSGVSAGCGTSRSFRQFGLPEKSSPSHQTVPASIASRSVCDIGGSTLRNAARMASLMRARRSAGMLSGMASSTKIAANARVSHGGSACATHATASAAAIATLQTSPPTLTYESASAPSRTARIQTRVSIESS